MMGKIIGFPFLMLFVLIYCILLLSVKSFDFECKLRPYTSKTTCPFIRSLR